MKERDEAEARLFSHTSELFKAHEKLLSDEHRNRAFYSALKDHVTLDSSVLDLGSGTGIWAIAAALLGARRVVAVEQDPLLIGLIRALSKENGVADRVEAIAAESRAARLEREFDLVVCEMIGRLGLEEGIISVVADARARFLKPGGVVIPQSISLVAAGAHLASPIRQVPAGVPIKYTVFDSLNIYTPLGLADRSELELVTEPRELMRADLGAVTAMPDLAEMTARWEAVDAARINCFAVWVEADLSANVRMSTMLGTSWEPLIYRVKPFAARRGVVEFNLSLTASSNFWTASLSNSQGRESRTYSPSFAGSALLAQSRTEIDLLAGPNRQSFIGGE